MVNELSAVVHELGGKRILGRTLSSDRDLREAIRGGFRPAVVEELMRASGLTLQELAGALDLSPRSLQRRRRSGRLARHESDRLYRLARIAVDDRPANGRAPAAPGELARLGDKFAQRGKPCLLLVPSVLAPSEHNCLINPAHPDYRKLKVREFSARVSGSPRAAI